MEDATTQNPYNEADGVKVQTRYKFDNPTNPATSNGTYSLKSNPYRTGNEAEMGWTVQYADKTGKTSTVKTYAGGSLPAPWGSNANLTGTVLSQTDANTSTVTDQAGKQRRSITNGLGQLVRVDEPNDAGQLGTVASPNQPTAYTYDTLNNLVQVNQGVQQRNFTYNSLSRLLSATNPESGTINYAYDASGNLTQKTDARGVITNYVYDNINRVVSRTYNDGTPNVTYTYENANIPFSKGRLTEVASSISKTKYTNFDNLGRVLNSQQITNDGQNPNDQVYNFAYSYNLSGALVNQTYPGGRIVTNNFETDGDLAQVNGSFQSQNKTYVGNFSYTSAGAVSAMQLGNGKWENTVFNSRLQPVQIGLGNSQTTQDLWKVNYDYGTTDNNGNVKSQTITVPSQFTAVQNYDYDSLNRLKSANEVIGNSQTWKQTFTFDRYGNRKFDPTQTTTLGNCPQNVCNPDINSANNRVVGHSFDNAGNTTVDAEGRSFFYDAENKQKEVRDASNNIIGQYFYDGDGKRVKKISANETTIFVYDAGGKLASEYLITTSNIQAPTTSYLTNDTLGSPRVITDASGNVSSRRDFMPYGEEIPRVNQGTDKVRQKFTSYERDNETELDFAQARMFGSGLGRFTSPDPLYFQLMMAIDPQRFNLYGYSRNNPLKWTDPSGERLYLRGDTAWLQTNVLYEMAGGQENFDTYFQITDGQVTLREGVNLSEANIGVNELAGLVGSTENYLYFAGTDGEDAAELFQGSTDRNGNLTTLGTNRANDFTGNNANRRGGFLVGTSGRAAALQPANLANGDSVFCAIAYNTNAVITQVGIDYTNIFATGNLSPDASGQLEGVGQVIKPVSYFIHESTENRKFEELGPSTGNHGKMGIDYEIAHRYAQQKEGQIRKELKITGGFSGGIVRPRVPSN